MILRCILHSTLVLLVCLGRAGALDRDDLSKLIAEKEGLVAVDPGNVDALRGLASLLVQAERYEEAIERYRELIERNPDDRSLRLTLARVQSWAKQYDDSIAAYRSLLDQAEREDRDRTSSGAAEEDTLDFQNIALELARVQAWAGRYGESLSGYETLLESGDKPGKDILLDYARTLSWDRQYRASIDAYREYLRRFGGGDDAEIQHELARVLSWAGMLEKARRHYMDLLESNPGDAVLLAELGDIYRWSGRVDLASRFYRKALESDHSNERALAGLEYVRSGWDRVELTPGFDSWEDSEGFSTQQYAVSTKVKPWDVTSITGRVESLVYEQDGINVEGFGLSISTRTFFGEMFRGEVLYRFADYGEPGVSHGYTAKIEYLHDLETTVGFSSSRTDLVDELFTIRTIQGGVIQSDNLMVYFTRQSRDRLALELNGLVGMQTDENKRLGARSVLTYMLSNEPYLSIGYRFTYLGFHERSARYWDPNDYTSHMSLVRFIQDLDPFRFQVEGGLGSGLEDGVRSGEYSVAAEVQVVLRAETVLSTSYAEGRTGRLSGEAQYDFSRWNVRVIHGF